MKQTIKSLALLALGMFISVATFAQVTTSSMSGKVTEKNGSAVVGATVVATHTPSGSQYYSTTDNSGNYRIQNMRIGGPYSVEVTLLGYGTVKTGGAYLKLGENFVNNVQMTEEAIALNELVVRAEGVNPLLNSDRTGAVSNFNSTQIKELPSISRSITDFTKLTPQANGVSFGGRDARMNTVTIDGAAFNTNFGLSTSNILPGGEAQPIALDAIEEITVNLSPFDIKQSQFTGASINAVTKSGTNRYTGSVYTYLRPKSFTGNKIGDNKIAGAHDSKSEIYGATVGGPIIKDKLFFFLSGEIEKKTTPSGSWEPSTDGNADPEKKISRTTVADLQKMHDFLKNTYGYEAGDYQNFSNFKIKNHKILARVDWNINKNHKLTVRYNEVISKNDVLTNSTSAPNPRGSGRISKQSIAFSNSWYGFENTVRSITGELNSKFGKVSNNLLVSYTMLEDKRTSPSAEFPFVDIYKGGDQYMTFGYELFTHNNDVKNNTFSIKDNVNVSFGDHNLTFGGSFDRLYFKNAYMREGTSYYRYNYNNTADPVTGTVYADGMEAFMANATPTAFGLTYGFNGEEAPGVELTFGMLALYAQDEWQVNDKLKLTAGIRAELPMYLNDLETNPAVDAFGFNKWKNPVVGTAAPQDYHIRSGKWPKSKLQVSPRIGFNWDVTGDRSVQLRGGTGLFSGFLPFVWFTNQPNGSGMIQAPEMVLDASNGGKDLATLKQLKFNPDYRALIKNNPTLFPQTKGTLPNGSGLCEVDKKFKMPQVWRTSVAADIELPWNMVFTLEEIFTKDIHAVMQKNMNLDFAAGRYEGSDNRPYWKNKKLNGAIGSAMLLTNTDKGFQNSLTAQLTKNMTHGFSGSIAYTWTIAKDITTNPGSTASSAWSSNPAIEYLNDPELSYSSFAIPHRIVANLSYRVEWLKNFATTFALTYTGGAQGRASWVYSNDMNGDGNSSDMMYIPASKNDILFTDLVYKDKTAGTSTTVMTAAQQAEAMWQLVEGNSYLKKHKGEYAKRFGYVEPWHNRWDVKIMQDIFSNFGTNRRFTLQASLDIVNVGNLLNKKWGAYKSMGSQSYDNLRPLTFSKSVNGMPAYTLNVSASSAKDNAETLTPKFLKNNGWSKTLSTGGTWGMQFGLRLIF